MTERLLTVKEVAEYWNVHPSTVRRLIKSKQLEAYRLGGEYRFALAHIAAYMQRVRIGDPVP